MKKITLLFISFFLLNSCKTYIDTQNDIKSDSMEFIYKEKENQFLYKSKLYSKAGNDIKYPNHFSINLPKKIKNWHILGNEFYFEYDSKQMIYINSGYKNVGNEVDWSLNDFPENKIYKTFGDYWEERNYNESSLYNSLKERINKSYSDGKVTIVLYNIKQENYVAFLEKIKTFKYL